ncbi:glyoxalase superfamily protein [Zhengella sp. ZM62]|uniref:glyoxalase superfamily protein n=1 Tax=Zhengella sedimenti TaxID=3390035 RepID=UPI0039749BC8
MNGNRGILPTIDDMKAQAKRLRADLETRGTPLSHAQALELVARQHGHRDWNTAHAAAGNRPPASFHVGQVLTGTYLDQKFLGEVIAVQRLGEGDRWRLTFRFDEPVDVVTFDSFSAYRHRVTVTVNGEGVTAEKTSNGKPHMRIDL